MMPTWRIYFLCVWDNEIINLKCLGHSWYIVVVNKCQLLLLLFIITTITSTSTMTRYPSLQAISHISVGCYLFLFRLPCRACPITSLSVDSSTAPDRALSSHWSPAPGQPIAGHFRSSSFRVTQSCESFLIHLVHVSTFSTIHHNYMPARHSLGNSLYEETCFSFRTLGYLLICLEPNVYFTQLGDLLPMSLEDNGNWGTWNGEQFSVFLLTVHNKLKWLDPALQKHWGKHAKITAIENLLIISQ